MNDIKEKEEVLEYKANTTTINFLNIIGFIGLIISIFLCFTIGLSGIYIFFPSVVCIAIARIIRNSLIQNIILYELLNKLEK